MAFKLLEATQNTWCRLDAHDLLPLVRAGVVFEDRHSLERMGAPSEKNSGRVAA